MNYYSVLVNGVRLPMDEDDFFDLRYQDPRITATSIDFHTYCDMVAAIHAQEAYMASVILEQDLAQATCDAIMATEIEEYNKYQGPASDGCWPEGSAPFL